MTTDNIFIPRTFEYQCDLLGRNSREFSLVKFFLEVLSVCGSELHMVTSVRLKIEWAPALRKK